MTRLEIATKIAKKTGISVSDSDKVLSEIGPEIHAAIANGDSVQIKGFATFKTKTVKAGITPWDSTDVEHPYDRIVVDVNLHESFRIISENKPN